MPSKISLTSDYHKLLRSIRLEMERGVKKVEELFERQKVLSHWTIGGKINAYLSKHDMPYGTIGPFYDKLSKDLGMHYRTLQQCEQFYRYFPKLKTHPNLQWSHYRFLLVVQDPAVRERWIERIKKDKIPADELRLVLMPKDNSNNPFKPGSIKTPTRGKLFTYRLSRAEDIENFDTPWFVDLGFAGRCEAPASHANLDNKYHYTSEKINGGYRLKTVNAKADELFTFRGVLRRVIDGDTLLVQIDQGFGYWNDQRLRLNAIDTPEMDTLAGQRAKKWIEDELKDTKNLVVKTYKSDQWDRYLVDVFYIPKESDIRRVAAEGTWLNAKMVEENIAKLWNAK